MESQDGCKTYLNVIGVGIDIWEKSSGKVYDIDAAIISVWLLRDLQM